MKVGRETRWNIFKVLWEWLTKPKPPKEDK
jgi:hypothetical protein